MKTVGNIILAVLATLLTVSMAFGQEVLFKEASGPNWPIFKEALEKDGLLKNDTFSTEVLAKNAYLRAKKEGLPAGNLPYVEFYQLFKFTNDLGDTVSVSEFRTLAQAGKIVLPEVNAEVPVAKVSVETKQVVQAAPVKTEQPAQSPALGLQAIAIANLQGAVAELTEKVGNTNRQQQQLAPRVEALQRQLSAIDSRQKSFVKKGDVMSEEELAALKKERGEVSTKLNDLEASLKNINAVQAGVEGRLVAVESSPVLAIRDNLVTGLVVLGSVALLFIGVMVANWRRTTAVKQEVKAEVSEVADRVTVVEEQIGGRAEIDTKALAQIVERVKLQNEEGKGTVQHLLTVSGKAYTLRFIFESAGYVMVEGVRDQTQKVHIDKVRSVVLRAAGSGRLVGVGKPLSIVDDDTIEIAAVDNPFASPQSGKVKEVLPAGMTPRRSAAG